MKDFEIMNLEYNKDKIIEQLERDNEKLRHRLIEEIRYNNDKQLKLEMINNVLKKENLMLKQQKAMLELRLR